MAAGARRARWVWRPAKSQPLHPPTGARRGPRGAGTPVPRQRGLPALTPPAPHLHCAPRRRGLRPQPPAPGASVGRGPGTPRDEHARPPGRRPSEGPPRAHPPGRVCGCGRSGFTSGDCDRQLGSVSLAPEQLAWVRSRGDSAAWQSQPHAPASAPASAPSPASPEARAGGGHFIPERGMPRSKAGGRARTWGHRGDVWHRGPSFSLSGTLSLTFRLAPL